MKRIVLFSALALFAMLSSGCVSAGAYNQLVERFGTEQQLTEVLQKDLMTTTELLKMSDEQLMAAREMLDNPVDYKGTYEVDSSELDETLAEIRRELAGSMGGWDLTTGNAIGTRLDDGGELLFRSGSWELTESATQTLNKIAGEVMEVLNDHPEYVVRVDGHTDSDPIRALRRKNITSNRQLSFMRANAVVEYLVSKGISDDRCTVMAHGEFHPVAEQKKLNRRVEIWVSTPEGFAIESAKESDLEGESSTVER